MFLFALFLLFGGLDFLFLFGGSCLGDFFCFVLFYVSALSEIKTYF